MPRLMMLLVLLIALPAAAETLQLPAVQISVEDGDTLIAQIDGQTRRIQLAGIDAPEDRDNPKLRVDVRRTRLDAAQLLPLGQVATEQLRFLLRQQAQFTLRFDPAHPDRYGRTPGNLFDEQGRSLAEQMVANGYAIPLARGLGTERAERLNALARQARRQHKGLWGLYPEATRRWAGGH